MNETTPFQNYVMAVGGQTKAARRLGVSRSMVGHIFHGRRGISKRMAVLVEQDSNGVWNRAQLLWPDDAA
jgi:DNA-binding transcriptional regulator YdaS (Cro superfamily)